MTAAAREFCIAGLGFNVNYEEDRVVGSGYYDAVHTVMGFMPYLPVVPDVKTGRAILHSKCNIYINSILYNLSYLILQT